MNGVLVHNTEWLQGRIINDKQEWIFAGEAITKNSCCGNRFFRLTICNQKDSWTFDCATGSSDALYLLYENEDDLFEFQTNVLKIDEQFVKSYFEDFQETDCVICLGTAKISLTKEQKQKIN